MFYGVSTLGKKVVSTKKIYVSTVFLGCGKKLYHRYEKRCSNGVSRARKNRCFNVVSKVRKKVVGTVRKKCSNAVSSVGKKDVLTLF